MVVKKEREGKKRREFPQQYRYWAAGTGSKKLSDGGGKVGNKVEILTEVLLYRCVHAFIESYMIGRTIRGQNLKRRKHGRGTNRNIGTKKE